MGDSLDGSGEPSPESQNVAIVEFPTFASYLRKAVTVLLPDEDVVPPAFNLALEERYNQDCIRKFLGDSQVSSLYVQRSSSKGERDRSIIIIIILLVTVILFELRKISTVSDRRCAALHYRMC